MAIRLWELLERVEKILLQSSEIEARGSAETEARRILDEAYRRRVGRSLTPMEFQLEAGTMRLDDSIAEQAERWARERRDGALLQHLLGSWFFLDHEYKVSRDVLVPRPETEILVLETLAALGDDTLRPLLGAEIGLGSGIISVELLSRLPALKMLATDVSDKALEIAKSNAREILGEARSVGLAALLVPGKGSPVRELGDAARSRGWDPGMFDFLVSNPPYLDPARADEEVEDEVLRHEPHVALFGPAEDVLHFYRDMAEGAAYLLKPEGFVAVELPHERAEEIVALFGAKGWIPRLIADLTGRNRVLLARRG